MKNEEKIIIKVLGQLQSDVKRLKNSVSYNGYSKIKSDLAGAELSLNHAMNKMTQ